MSVERGRLGEDIAARHLLGLGYEVVARNWRTRWSEIDIIARRQGEIRFVEVKYRRDVRYGHAADYVTRDKTARLRRAAQAWCVKSGYAGGWHIDIVCVEGELACPAVTIIEDAVEG